MSDQIIHDSVSKASILLAYGESKNRSSLWLSLIAVFVLLVGTVAGIVVLLGQNSFPLPSNTFLLTYVRPGAILPEGTPELWRENAKKSPHSPIFLGLMRLDGGKISPFTVSIRGIGSNEGITSGIWNLDSEQENGQMEPVTLRSLVDAWTDYAANAWIQLWPGRITAWPNVGFETDLRVGGPISESVIRTNLRFPKQTSADSGYRGDNFIRASAVPSSWQLIEPILRAQGLGIFLDTPPKIVAWSNKDNEKTSFYFEFDEMIASSTRSLLAGGYGLTDNRQYSLSDGTILSELMLPTDAIAQSTSQTWDLPGGEALQFKTNTAILGDSKAFEEIKRPPEACQGTVVAAFDNKTTANLAKQVGIQIGTGANDIVFVETDSHLNVCF